MPVVIDQMVADVTPPTTNEGTGAPAGGERAGGPVDPEPRKVVDLLERLERRRARVHAD